MKFAGLVIATLLPSVASAGGVVPIAPQPVIDAIGVPKGDGFSGYLSAMYGAGVAGVAVIAVVMIVWGAIQVFGESVWGKTQGKSKIWNAVWGLLLAAGSFVILRTVSASLVQADFALEGNLGAETQGVAIGDPDSGGTTNRPDGSTGMTVDGYTRQSGPAAAEIARAAEAAVTAGTRTTCYTAGGRTSCAYAADDIIETATGYSVTGSGAVTDMYNALLTNSDYDQISGGFAASRPGDIIISPNGNRRHVGIITTAGGNRIVSNSSNGPDGVAHTPDDGQVMANFNGTSWSNYYGSSNVFIFRPTGSVNTD